MNKIALLLSLLLAFAGLQPVVAAETTPAQAAKFATVYGAKIHYVDQGQGPVVVLLHGLADSTVIWQSTIDALSTRYRVIAYDHLGAGQSDKPLISYRVGTLVDVLDGFLKALEIKRATLIGNSVGGWVAINFAGQNPEKIDRLVLIDSAGYAGWPTPEIANALRLATRADFRKLNGVAFYDSAELTSDDVIDEMFTQYIASNDSHAILQLLDSAARNEDVIDDIAKNITQPTLIVWGEADRLVPLSLGQRLRRDIPKSRLHIIPKCGHMPEIECPASLNPLLLDFLAAEKQN